VRWQRTGTASRGGSVTLCRPVFLGLLPFLVAGIGPRLDRRLGLRPLRIGTVGRILAGVLAAAGFSLGFWSVYTQLDRGRGTPLPVMPTQELLTEGPFRYCRNPMTLGAISPLGRRGRRDRRGVAIVVSLAVPAVISSPSEGGWPRGPARRTWRVGR
jgi:hypothetical protein